MKSIEKALLCFTTLMDYFGWCFTFSGFVDFDIKIFQTFVLCACETCFFENASILLHFMWFLQFLVDEHSPDVGSVFGLLVFLVQFKSTNLQIGVAWCCSTVSIHECRINDAIEIVFATSHDHQLIVCLEPLSFQQPCHLVLQTPKLVAVHPNCMLSNDVLCVHHCMIWIPLKNIYADRMQKVDPCPRDPGNLRTFTRLRRTMHWL